MIPEFLAFRYQGVRRIDEIQAKPSDIGWKCRKYIRWRQVHNSKTDAKTLYAFADDLMEKGHLRKELYGAISAVCLNVQKWRLDKENLSIEPPHRKEWEQRYVLFKAIQTNPALIPARLSEQHLRFESLSNIGIQILFYASELDALLQSQNIEGYPSEPVSKSLLSGNEADFSQKLQQRFRIPYTFLGVPLPKQTEPLKLLRQVADDLGYDSLAIDPKLSIPTTPAQARAEVMIELVPLEKYKLLQIDCARGIDYIRLNSRHPFVKGILTDGKLHPKLELFLRSYASCTLRMGGSIDTLETFNSYLGLDLHNARPSEPTPK